MWYSKVQEFVTTIINSLESNYLVLEFFNCSYLSPKKCEIQTKILFTYHHLFTTQQYHLRLISLIDDEIIIHLMKRYDSDRFRINFC